jgi:hypothetical protein
MQKERAHACRARALGLRLRHVPRRTGLVIWHGEQPQEPLARLRRHRAGGLPVVAAVDERSGGPRDLQECAECWQFEALSRQLLDRGIDDVRRVVAAVRGLDRRNRRRLARQRAVGGDADVVAYERHQP